MKSFAIVLAIIVLAFFGYGFIRSSSPAGKERSEARIKIDLCWERYALKSLAEEQKRVVAGICERMEAEFLARHGTKP